MDIAEQPNYVRRAIEHAESHGWVVVSVRSFGVADLGYLARHYDAPELLELNGAQFEVYLDVDFAEKEKRRIVANACTEDLPDLKLFLAAPSKMLVVCNTDAGSHHFWPEIQLS